jgi:hypothetical protein
MRWLARHLAFYKSKRRTTNFAPAMHALSSQKTVLKSIIYFNLKLISDNGVNIVNNVSELPSRSASNTTSIGEE